MSEAHQTLLWEVGLAMQRYQRSVQAFDDAVGRQLGLGPADLRCLDWLADGPKSAGQLTTATGLRPAATTALIDRLADKGLVERVADDTDRRRVLVQMTAEGVRQTGACYRPLVDEGQQAMRDITERDLTLMRDFLVTITEMTDRHRDRMSRADSGADPPG